MADRDENTPPQPPPQSHLPQPMAGALCWGPKKKPTNSDPLVSCGRHFGRTIHVFATMHSLLVNGLYRAAQDSQTVTCDEEAREQAAYEALLVAVPGLERRLMEASADEVRHIADLLQKGMNGARSDDTKSLKSAILDWITPRGQALQPVLKRNSKFDRGFNHVRTGSLLCPAHLDYSVEDIREKLKNGEIPVNGNDWCIFLYAGESFDPEDPWNGLFRGPLLVQAYKHIFTSPSSVEREPKATRSGNARIHGMTKVTKASIAYVATQVRFALSSAGVFSRTDMVTDSECFYSSILRLLDEDTERAEVNDLLVWWNRQIFPEALPNRRAIADESPLARIAAKRRSSARTVLRTLNV